jgi:hypothetical protein
MQKPKQESSHGGKRPGAGRKPIEDKKKQIHISLRESEIEKLGGKENVKFIVNKLTKSILNK